MSSSASFAWLVAVIASSGCLQKDIDQVDGAFYKGGKRAVHCSIDIDSVTHNDEPSIDGGLDRARDRGEVIELFAHIPGKTVSWDAIEYVLAGAKSRGLPFYTYGDLASGTVSGPGLAFAFDDDAVDAWTAGRDMFSTYDARLTFFSTRYDLLQDSERAELKQLSADGHDIQAHSVRHLRGPQVVEDIGLDAYMSTEVQPSIDRLVADGYTVNSYAYPFGARTDQTDAAILKRVAILRSVAMTWGVFIEEPCPD
jgi:hypothetical protein